MHIISGLSYDEMSRRAAGLIVAQLNRKPTSTLALPWGNSPKGTYEFLSQYFPNHFEEAKVFALDEVVGPRAIGQEQLDQTLFNKVNLPTASRFYPTEANQSNYDELITKAGGIDLLYLGLGLNGHIAFNEPGTAFSTLTHRVKLEESTIQDCMAKYKVAVTEGITMGPATIMAAKEIVLLISGENKRDIAREVLFGSKYPEIPASVLQDHNDVTVLIDFKL